MSTNSEGNVKKMPVGKLAAIFDSFDSRPTHTGQSVLRAARLGDQLWSRLAGSPVGNPQANTIRRALTTSTATTQELEHLKRELTRQWETCPQDNQGVLMLFYHAVIARAYALHGSWITSRQLETSLAFYQDLALILRHAELGRVFVDACRIHEPNI